MSKKKTNTKTLDLATLNQQSVAWLINRSPAWLRRNSHRFHRAADGSYNAREVVSVLLEMQREQLADPRFLI